MRESPRFRVVDRVVYAAGNGYGQKRYLRDGSDSPERTAEWMRRHEARIRAEMRRVQAELRRLGKRA